MMAVTRGDLNSLKQIIKKPFVMSISSGYLLLLYLQEGHGADATCTVEEKSRTDCFPNVKTTASECEAAGCCWSADHIPGT